MTTIISTIPSAQEQVRQAYIVDVFVDGFGRMIKDDPAAWKSKFRKMSATPFAFFRGSAALFLRDMVDLNDTSFLNDKTRAVWVHGDLHAENFGTYMNSAGVLVFDVNDFDEAYIAPFTWDIKRLATSLSLIGFSKALSDEEIELVLNKCLESYVDQVATFAEDERTKAFALTLDNTSGITRDVLLTARLRSRVNFLNQFTEIDDFDRRFRRGQKSVSVGDKVRERLDGAFKEYIETIPHNKLQSGLNYAVKDVVEIRATGIGSAGYKMYSILMEGANQALENDIVISMKVGQTPSAYRVAKNERAESLFQNNGHRTVLSQRALQAYADPWIGHASLDGVGMFVSELSPYSVNLEWDHVDSLDDIVELVSYLGQAVAKIHCVSDIDADPVVVPFSTDKALHDVLVGKEKGFVDTMTEFGMEYGNVVRDDYRLFVDAFRNHLFRDL